MLEIRWEFVLEISEVLTEEAGRFFENAGLELGRRIDQDHLGYVDGVCPVRLLSKEPLVDIESLKVKRAH